MPHEMSPGKRTTRRYSEAEKERAVRAVRQLRKELGADHGTVKRVADQLGVGVETLRGWVKQAEIDAGVKPGVTTVEAERVRQLEQENRELRRANEMADSTGGRNDLGELLRWCQIAEGLAWSAVEAALDAAQLGGADFGEVGALRQVLAKEAVGVLVRSALPWRVWIAEVDGDARGDGEVGVIGHLGALVPGDRSAQLVGQRRDRSAHRGVHRGGRAVSVQVQQEHQAGGALDQRADSAARVRAQDQIAFPVARHGAVIRFCRALRDHHHAGEPSAAFLSAARPPRGAPRSEASGQFSAKLAAPLNEQRSIDRLVAHAHRGIVGMVQR